MNISKKEIRNIVNIALKEDRAFSDITTHFSIPAAQISEAIIFLKEDACLSGLELAKAVFKRLDNNIILRSKFSDGSSVKKGTVILNIQGKTRAILSAERTALNFLGHLSGISTLTNQFVYKIKGTKAKILDTRKTTPGLRSLEKYAVKCGGGENHRFNLNDMGLLKDNHWAVLKRKEEVLKAIQTIKRKTKKKVEVEVDDLNQLRYIVDAGPDIVLLDNMSSAMIKEAVRFVKSNPKTKNILLEVSGGVNLKNVRSYALTGVDRISVGALTHSAKNIDFSLEVKS